jgi:WD40 repeat protein
LAIAEPAARNGVTFEAGLIDQIIADFKQQTGSLPLLQYTLNLLWKDDGINDDDRVLNIETYEKLGGVTGALEKQADEIFKNPHNEPEKLNEAERKASEQIFIKLIGLEGKEPVSKRQNKSLFCDGAMQESALNKLVDNRLLVIQGEGEKATVEVAHEALLRSWEVLQDLIRDKEEILILRTRLDQDAKNWQDLCEKNPSQAKYELLTGPRLNRIIKLIQEKYLVDLDSVIVKFIRASWEYQQQLQKNEADRKQREIDSELSLANSLGRYSLSIFEPGRSLKALIEAIKAGKILQKHKAKDLTVVSALHKSLTQGMERNQLVGHESYVNSVSFSRDGQTLASASYDNTIKLWQVETGEELRTLTGHENGVNSVSFSPDGQTLASASDDNTIKLWQVETGEELRTLTGHENVVNSVSFSRDGQTLASASDDETIKLWQVETGEELRTLTGHEDIVNSVSFSPDGQTLASASYDKTIKLWQVETGEELRTLTGHENVVNSVSFSRDGKTLASASYDKTIKLWQVETGEELRTLTGHEDRVNSVSFSPDGKTLASASYDETIKLWQVETGEELRTLTGHENIVNSVSFSPDGQTLASASWDKTIKLWQVETGEELRTLTGHENIVNSVSFSADGQTLASASSDGTSKLWDLNLDSLMAKSCDWVRNYLTYNPNVSESDRHLCDGIGTKQ